MSPIQEDPRSALEELAPPFPNNASAPGMRTGLSNATDATTPRAVVAPTYGGNAWALPAQEDKGKGREQGGSVPAPAYSSGDGYFSNTANMPAPQIATVPYVHSHDMVSRD